ncbi:MAG: hypothetical protein QOJ95_5860 [Mycobacterium sp.]|nr:hypothetical protein [Mycobacterium sp.]
MTTVELVAPSSLHEAASISWWDPASECTVTIADPKTAPGLFADYHRGAVASYSRFGVADAIDGDVARCADDTALFWTMTDDDGRVIGGIRTKGRLSTPDDSHAVVEWAGRPGEHAVRTMIADRIPSGVIEMKAAWSSGNGTRHPKRANLLARSGFHLMALLGVDFFMATSAAHTLEQWRSGGGVVAPIPATPYPDERYQTKMMWWDRRTFTVHGEPAQVASIIVEMAQVRRRQQAAGHLRGPDPRGLAPRARGAMTAHHTRSGQLR